MERLTYRDDEGCAQWTHALLEDDSGMAGPLIRDRLAAYEDTGLEPEDFKRAFHEDAVLKLAGQALGIAPDRLRELAQANREGRVHIEEKTYQCPKCGAYRLTPRLDKQFYFCFKCKTQFTREEAEAALKGEQDG